MKLSEEFDDVLWNALDSVEDLQRLVKGMKETLAIVEPLLQEAEDALMKVRRETA